MSEMTCCCLGTSPSSFGLIPFPCVKVLRPNRCQQPKQQNASLIASSAYQKNHPRGVVACTRGSPKKRKSLTHFKFENRSRTTCSRFFQHSLYLINVQLHPHTQTHPHTPILTHATSLPSTQTIHTTQTQLFPSTKCSCQDWEICALTAFLRSAAMAGQYPTIES